MFHIGDIVRTLTLPDISDDWQDVSAIIIELDINGGMYHKTNVIYRNLEIRMGINIRPQHMILETDYDRLQLAYRLLVQGV